MVLIKFLEIWAKMGSEDRKAKYGHIFGYLANQYTNRAFRTGSTGDLDKAVASGRLCAQLISRKNVKDKAGALLNLSNNLRRRYEQDGNSKYLAEAIDSGQEALEYLYWTPDETFAGMDIASFFNDLANKISLRYESTLNMADLDRSIHLAQLALLYSHIPLPKAGALATAESPKPRQQDQIGVESNRRSHEHINSEGEPTRALFTSGSASHKDNAIKIDISSGDPLFLYTLGVKLFLLYLRKRESAILDQAIKAVENSITGEGNSFLAKRKSALSNYLCERYRISKHGPDIVRASKLASDAILLVGSSSPFDILFIVTSAANALLGAYAEKKDQDHLLKASIACRIGLDASPLHHIQRPRCLNILGMAQEKLYRANKDPQCLDSACDSFIEAWNKKSAPLLQRACSVTNLLPLLAERRRFEQGAKVAKETVDLLHIAADKYRSRLDRQYSLSLFTPIAAQICALYVEIGNLELALQHLEIARTVIFGQLMDHRNATKSLKQIVPSYALMLDRQGNEVNIDTFNEMRLHEPYNPGPPFSEGNYREQVMAQLNHGWRNEKREEILKELRDSHKERPVLREFLRPQNIVQKIQASVGDGTVVIVNATTHRSDAILISSALTEAIPLSQEFEAEATSRLAKKWDGSNSKRRVGNDDLRKLLAWLWRSCVQPILEQIRKSKASRKRQRIWWIGTGAASALPFHAAGVYDPGVTEVAHHTENAYHQTLSSYISSLTALVHSKEPVEDRDLGSSKIMIATMPTTPGLVRLTGVTEEADAIKEVISHPFLPLPLELQHPTSKRILENLRPCSFVHFACHGDASPHDPSESGMIFQREVSGDLKQDILTVRDISKIDLWSGSVAYLSACSTAENKAPFLSEEAMNLVTVFQAAGFRHVVGCLWESTDKVNILVAKEFYTSLFRNGGNGWKETDVLANALREAVMESWKTSIKQPLSWAPFVHYGP
ncbi:MAG: hypothetical protein M1837_005394 [Sclerophora amabilis]|nr:MAG: hypothetical protein M1837_005394 [Sclerophora amabilis]